MPSLPPQVPEHLAEMLERKHLDAPGRWADGVPCEGAKYHSPMPLVLHLVSLHPLDHTNRSREALLCATCVENLRVLQRLQLSTDDDIPWDVRREFANNIRALARRGWEMIK